MTHTIHIIVGPTASGKSAIALDLAKQLNGVIINADSRQIYEDLPTLTAQPTSDEKKSVPHELYGVLHANEMSSAGNWCTLVEPVIEKTFAAGKTPIVVGGTGFYIKALTEGLSPMPAVPPEIRAAAIARQIELGNPAFHEELMKRDPVTAARFHPSHTARLVRAWEVLEATGKSLSEWQKEDKLSPPSHWNFEIRKIMPDKETLDRNCDTRFLKMIDAGVLDEICAFAAKIDEGQVRADSQLINSLGFSPLLSYAKLKEAGNARESDLAAAIAQGQLETRQYAKRQMTWFRNQL